MKIKMFILIIITIMLISGCMQSAVTVPSASENPAVVSSSPSPTEPEQTANPIETTVIPSVASAPSDETLVVTDGPIPGLLGNQWYDFDKAGAYPGASVVQCGNKIAFQLLVYRGEMDYDSYLAFADPDGKHCVKTKILDPSYPNYKDGWVYFINDYDCISKVKTDGSGLIKIFKEKKSIAGASDIVLSNLFITEGSIYFFENVMYKNSEKSSLFRMNLDGSERVTLDEFDHSGLSADFYLTDYLQSLFYYSGKLYYTDPDPDSTEFDLYQYDIAANSKTCLVRDLVSDYNGCKIVVRGDEIYYSGTEGLCVYTISTGKNELFAQTKNISFMDFAFFDRWLLMSGDDGLYCYDIDNGKLYLADDVGCARNIVLTQNHVYYEEPDDYPFLYPIIFKNGTVTQGKEINVRK